MTDWLPPPDTAPAGWYPDPHAGGQLRYFDGREWTRHTSGGVATAPRTPTTAEQPHPLLPLPAALGGVAVLAISLVVFHASLDRLADLGWSAPVLLVVVAAMVYAPVCLWMWFASRRWGSGRVFADLGIVPRWTDLGWGVGVVLPCVYVFAIVAAIFVQVFDIPFRSNLDFELSVGAITGSRRAVLWSYGLSLVLVAPVVEEALFRGMVLRGFLSRMAPALAIVAQGLLFGAAHFSPSVGRESIGLVVVVTAVGLCLGGAAYFLRRIGPTVLAHAGYNLVAFLIAIHVDFT